LGPISYNGGDWTLESNLEYANLGYAVAAAGDVNGDGYAEVLIGAPHYTNGQSKEGQVSFYYGNGRAGVPLVPRQLDNSGGAPIAPLGLLQTDLKLEITARTPTGRGKVKLVSDVNHLSAPFNGAWNTASSWSDTGVSGVVLQATDTSLGLAESYHWRVRLRYNLITNPFNPPNSRWIHMPWNGWNEADLRTVGGAGGGGYYLNFLPFVTKAR
jgi:hypothetical protein